MVLDILIRHKNKDGKTFKYTVSLDNSIKTIDLDTLKSSFGNSVNNAYLVNGEYRAKKGYHIKTVVDNTSLAVQKVMKPDIKVSSSLPNDFYGKDFIGVCRRLRRYANLGKITVRENKHSTNNGNNVHLFDIIKLCGLSISEFVVGYLSVIQPYCLDYFQRSKAEKAQQKWFIELGYSTRMVIKLDERDKNNPVIVSFHESNIERKGSHSYQSGVHDFSNKPCALLIDGVNNVGGSFVISANLQTGFIRYRLVTEALVCNNDIALVEYDSINTTVNSILNTLFSKISSLYLSGSAVPEFSNKNDCISFSGRGYATINQLILIMDLYSVYSDTNSVKVLSEMLKNIVLELDKDERSAILGALEKRYGVSPRNKIAILLYKELES